MLVSLQHTRSFDTIFFWKIWNSSIHWLENLMISFICIPDQNEIIKNKCKGLEKCFNYKIVFWKVFCFYNTATMNTTIIGKFWFKTWTFYHQQMLIPPHPISDFFCILMYIYPKYTFMITVFYVSSNIGCMDFLLYIYFLYLWVFLLSPNKKTNKV